MRWTIEVLPEAGAKKAARAKKTARKPQAAKSPVKKPRVPVAPPAEPKEAARTAPAATPPAPVQRTTWMRAIVPVAAVMLVVAAVAFPRRSSAPAVAGLAAQPEQHDVVADVAPSAPRLAPAPAPSVAPAPASMVAALRPVNEPAKKPAVKPVATRVTGSGTSLAHAAAPAVAETAKHEEPATPPTAPEVPAAAPTTATATSVTAPVTVTGCLEVSTDGDTFRLNDVEGADAPKSRSWRTGFLKKRPAPVILVEPPDRHALTANVGHRVAATGELANRELKIHSLHVVGSSCN